MEEYKMYYNKLNLSMTVVTEFWSNVYIPKDHVNDCWKWISYTNFDGYGTFQKNNVKSSAHRLSYQSYFGKITDANLCVMHSCNNRWCVNPNHLSLGTRTQNNQYMVDCDRQAKGDDIHHCKLSDKLVIELLERISNNYYVGCNDILKDYDITYPILHKLLTGKLHKHLTNLPDLQVLKDIVIRKTNRITEHDLENIKIDIQNKSSIKFLKNKYNISKSTIYNIKNKHNL